MATVSNAKTLFVEAEGITYGYRHLGPPFRDSIPLVCLQHFRGTMDRWDPDLIDRLAERLPVILIDNAGVGYSTGEVADSVAGMARHIEIFLEALGVKAIYLYGFSLGGMVAQQLTLDTLGKGLVKKLMIVGSSPGSGPDTPPGTLEVPDIAGVQAESRVAKTQMSNLQKLFFYPSETSQAAGEAYWHRLENARPKDVTGEEAKKYMPLGQGLANMATAGAKWSRGEGVLDRLHEISDMKVPVLIANGKNDYMLPTQHSWEMSKRMPNAWFFVYPDSGHGAGFQFAKMHAAHLLLFLQT